MVKEKTSKSHKTLTIIGIVLCVILIPILLINITLIAKSYINEDEVPSIGGVFPMIVLTDSMYPEIKSGDIIFCRTVEAASVEEGMVISFFDPAGSGSAIVTHQVIEIVENEDGTRSFRTKGTNNNTEDKMLVPQEKLVGRYTDVRIPYAGNVALFMQTTYGLIVCVFIPFALLVGYDIIRRRKNEKTQNNDVAVLMAELEKLKAEKAEKEKEEEKKEENIDVIQEQAPSCATNPPSAVSEEKSDDETVILPSEATTGDGI